MTQDNTDKFKRPLPLRQNERLRDNLIGNDQKDPSLPSFPITEKSPSNKQPQKRTINRGKITKREDDKLKNIAIGLQDHDEAIAYYFENVIKPLIYGNPERWKSIQQDGYYRDKEGKIQTPIIMFKRDSIEKRRDLGNKMDANNPQLYYVFQSKYNKRNQYDNFSTLQNRVPNKEFHAVVIPDYVKLKYSFTIWTDYIAQMNKITEAINYASDSYWGDEERFKFNAKIDTFTNRVEVSQGNNRMVKTDFGLELQGYIIPEAMSAALAKKPQKFYSKSTVIFNSEIELTSLNTPTSRETARGGEQNIGRNGDGISYDDVGTDNNVS